MIGRISGTLIEKQAPEIVVDVNGVGYELLVPMTTLYQLGKVGEPVKLFTHFAVREDAQILFGFADKQQRELFRTLIKVNGVGPKMGLAILSGIESQELVRCVHDNDIATMTKIPGVGKKTAERLIMDLKDRLKEWQIDADLPLLSNTPQQNINGNIAQMAQEAESALTALGYKPAEATKAVNSVKTQASSAEDLIRLALKGMIK